MRVILYLVRLSKIFTAILTADKEAPGRREACRPAWQKGDGI